MGSFLVPIRRITSPTCCINSKRKDEKAAEETVKDTKESWRPSAVNLQLVISIDSAVVNHQKEAPRRDTHYHMRKSAEICVKLCEIRSKCNFVAPQKLTHRERKCHLQSLGPKLAEGGLWEWKEEDEEEQGVLLEKPPNVRKSSGFAKH